MEKLNRGGIIKAMVLATGLALGTYAAEQIKSKYESQRVETMTEPQVKELEFTTAVQEQILKAWRDMEKVCENIALETIIEPADGVCINLMSKVSETGSLYAKSVQATRKNQDKMLRIARKYIAKRCKNVILENSGEDIKEICASYSQPENTEKEQQ